MLLRSHSRTTVEQTLRALPALHDRGIIQSIDWYPLRADDPQFFHCIATVGVPGEGSGKEAAYSAGGTALTKDAALAKAIGEAIERYCASAYDPSRVTVSPYRKLGSQAIDPRRFDLFSPDQRRSYSFPFE